MTCSEHKDWLHNSNERGLEREILRECHFKIQGWVLSADFNKVLFQLRFWIKVENFNFNSPFIEVIPVEKLDLEVLEFFAFHKCLVLCKNSLFAQLRSLPNESPFNLIELIVYLDFILLFISFLRFLIHPLSPSCLFLQQFLCSDCTLVDPLLSLN